MSIVAAENAGPGPCDLQDPLWVKMSAVTGNITKKRKKSDAKPQSQINKCLNEKRRRTQENHYIDELAELISATDMSSGKTDKCQILQRTVDQIQLIRQQEGSNSHAVQQGEVSSSNPNILSNDQVGPILLEALDGFLFVVNTEGRVEYVTDNISQYISYTKDDVFGKDIYNIIHHGDHNTFMPSLLPMSIGLSSEPQSQTRNRTFNCRFLVKPPDDKEETMEEKQQRVSKYENMHISAALLPSNSDRLESGGDVSSESSEGPRMMCVARRIPHSEKPMPTIKQFTMKLDPRGRITSLDGSGLSPAYAKYIGKDLIGMNIQDLCHPQDFNQLNAHLEDTFHSGDNTTSKYRLRVKADKFLNVQTKSRLFKANTNGEDADFVMVTHSIIGDNELTSIEGGQLSNSKCSGHSSNRCTNNSNNNNGNNNNNVGGPLMTGAHLNGQSIGNTGRGLVAARAPTSSSSSSNLNVFSANDSSSCNPLSSLITTSNSFNQFSGSMDLGFELYPSSTWDLDGDTAWGERPESRASGRTNSRPNSQPAPASPSPQGTTFSVNSAGNPVASHCSPMHAFSPSSAHSNTRSFSNPFPFSPLQDTQNPIVGAANTNGGVGGGLTKRLEDSKGCPGGTINNFVDAKSSQHSAVASASAATPAPDTLNCLVSTESGRLRNLLTKGPNASACDENQENTNNSVSDNQNKHKILKGLLKEADDDDQHLNDNDKIRASNNTMSKSTNDHSKSSSGNNMLLQLLNDKNDDDDLEAKAGLKRRNELLQQLLKDQDEERKIQDPQNRDEDPLLKSLGFRNQASPHSQSGDHGGHGGHGGQSQVGQKRPGEDGDENLAVKRTMDQVLSGGFTPTTTMATPTSKLWEKNKMLASLLAKQPSQTTTIPPIPNSILTATPQDKLPRVNSVQTKSWSNVQTNVSNSATTTTTSSRTPIHNQPRQLPRNQTNIYINDLLNQSQRPPMGPLNQDYVTSGEYRRPGLQIDANNWENQSSDPVLSDILDQVIDNLPDETMSDPTAIINLLDVIDAPQNNALNEKIAAINAIQRQLMQCETVVNPTSSTITMSGTPPAYSTALGNTPVTSGHNYQPPPMYQHQRRFNPQQSTGRQPTAQFTQQQQLQLQQQRAKLIQAQQQQQQQLKQRLLQQQQQQQLVIPSNAAATDQISNDIHHIDSLLNNTVAPNVSLQRSTVTDSQASPGYGGLSVQLPTHRLSHSYSHPSTLPQHSVVNSNFNNGQQVSATARLSPHSPAGIMSFPHPQSLSPRVSQGNYGNGPRMFVNPVRPQQQQSAPQQQQPQRSMPSPGTPASARQSPFPADAFPPPPASPTASQFPPVPNTGAANPSGQYRLQRTNSTPSATTQLPGGISSPRHYGGMNKEQPLLSPSHPHSGCPSQPSHNQHNVTNTQHLSNQQHSSMIYHPNSTLNSADVQNNQFCYDRASVSLYSSGPGDTSNTRPLMTPGNPNSHQMGGNVASGGNMTSEFVRQELRAIVGARTQQQQQQQRIPNNIQNNLSGQVSQEELDALGLTYEMSSAGEAVVSDGPAKSWAIGSAGSAPSSSRTTMEEAVRGDPKSSLLQKLLSE